MELILVDHESNETYSRKVLNSLSQKSNVKIINFSGPFNYAEMMNNAARSANGEILVLLNNDTEIIEPDWLEELVAQVSRPEVGVVGALLLFKNGTVQHAGIHPGINSFMNHGHKHWPGNHPGYFGRLLIAHEVAAVTGACLAIKTSDWERLGGMDENNLAVAYNDVDLCLKARSMGKKIIFTPHAKLIHHESLSRGFEENSLKKERLSKEIKVMQERWGELLNSDPAYNPNLDQKSSSFILNDKPLNQPEWAIK
tara:strand:- start:804 stop:1568 length:765 start_codon:yes stop_codon:yes gene_type:complete